MRAAIHILAVILGLASLPLSSYSQRTLGDYIRFCSALSGRTPTPDSIRNWDRQGSAAGRYDGRLELVSVRSAGPDTLPPPLVECDIPAEIVWYTPADSLSTSVSPMYDYSPGEIPFTCAVSQTGASTVAVPIECYSDPQGLTPQISLSYSSLAGSGPLGQGWSLTGLSAISRIPRSIYYDGAAAPVTGDSTDAFSLDGSRLIRQRSSAGRIYYQTETGNTMAVAAISGRQIQSFRYDMHGNRTRLVLTGDSTHWGYTKYYMDGIYEVTVADTMVREVLWLGGDAYSAGTAYVRESGGTWTLWSVQRDRQGCITGVCNAGGEVLWRGSYDAWGNMRNPDTWTLYNADSIPEPLLGRGYTRHEHLTPFGLVNMNARLYDPMLGRFLSPDNLMQAPSLGQNYNRYSYCLNNPLRYTDQSGEIFGIDDILVGMAIGAIINVAYQGFKGNIHNPMDVFKAATIGAAGAAVASMTVAWSGIAAVGVIGGAKVGAIAGLSGSITTGIGNAMGFSDDMSLQDVFFSTTRSCNRRYLRRT